MRNNLKTAVLLGAFGGLIMMISSFFGRGALVVGLFIALAVVGGSYWFSDKIAIKAARAQPVTEPEMPEYYRIVRQLAQAANMPMPKLYTTPDRQPNAFATGRNPKHAAVAVTAGILEICDWEELQGVLAHELSHVGNRDILISSVAAALAMVITFVARMAMWGAIFGGGRNDEEGNNAFGVLAMALLGPLAAGLLQMALSRSREFEADRSGARLLGTGEPLARALEKLEQGAQRIPMNIDAAHATAYIVNPLRGERGQRAQLAGWFRSHPPTEARVARLRSGEWQR